MTKEGPAQGTLLRLVSLLRDACTQAQLGPGVITALGRNESGDHHSALLELLGDLGPLVERSSCVYLTLVFPNQNSRNLNWPIRKVPTTNRRWSQGGPGTMFPRHSPLLLLLQNLLPR